MNTIEIEPINISDAKAYFELILNNVDQLSLYFPGTVKETDTQEKATQLLASMIEAVKSKSRYPFGIYKEQTLIGWISIKNIDWNVSKCELGYYLDKNHYGNGYMQIAVEQIIKFAFENLQLNKIFLRIGVDNIASQRLAEKCKFELEGTIKEDFRLSTGELVDLNYYGLFNASLNSIQLV